MDVIERLRLTDAVPVGTNTEVSDFAEKWFSALSPDDRYEANQRAQEEGALRVEGIMLVVIPWEDLQQMWAMYQMEQDINNC